MIAGLYDAFLISIQVVAEPTNIFLLVLATLFGMFIGMLPGLGGTIALALLIPLTFGINPLVAFMILAAAKGGTNFGGSMTAILINTPGSPPNAATLIDGFPMARAGEGGRAIGASAAASAFGAIVGVLVLLISIPIMVPMLLLFGPSEIFWIGIWGLTVIAIVVSDEYLKGLISAVLGLLFAFHGLNIHTASNRWTYDLAFMDDGFKLIPALIGLFAIAEMINLLTKDERISTEAAVSAAGGKWRGVKDVFIHRWLFLRSSIIGVVTGIIPGIGGAVANYVAYFQAVQTSKNSETFGSGDVRGVIASESSNDAKDGGAFLPTLAFGIPGSASMAVLFGAFILHGINPGPLLFQLHLDIVMIIIVSLVLSNLISSLTGLLLADYIVLLTNVDIRALAPIIIGISFFGTYALNNNIYDLYIALFFGLFGFVMIVENMSRVPMILAMVLAPIVEQNYFRTLQIAGDASGFVSSPLAIALLLLVVVSLFQPYLKPIATTILTRVLP